MFHMLNEPLSKDYVVQMDFSVPKGHLTTNGVMNWYDILMWE